MGAVVGIDLGTTNTVVAAMRGGSPVAILDETGSSLIPSIVSFLPSGAVLVGNAAKERRTDDTKNTVYSVKRLIGRPWDSPEVRQARSRFSFELREGPGRATFVVARNETFTLPEISAYVLRKVKSIAEIELGESVERAVVTVPANFNDLQRAATKVAGRVAGLEILRILNEPTAAALAYGHNQGAAEKIAVFDFGGGTFDITLLSLTESVFEVLATAGNTFLGGDDLDWAIAEKMADEFSAHHGRDIRKHPVALEHLRAAAEAVKIRLVTEDEAEVSLELGLGEGESNLPLTFNMSRAEFERLASPIVDRAFDVCREVLGVARVGISDIDHVLLVGGCTRIPCVRQRVEEYFKRELDSHIDPHEVVALGAALQAHALTASRTSTARLEIPPAPAISPAVPETNSTTEWRQKTQPFGRLGSTNIGVGQTQSPDTNIQVPPPDEALSRPIPTTKHMGSRGRLNTAMGIGPSSDLPPIAAPGQLDNIDPEDLLPVVAGTGRSPLVDAAKTGQHNVGSISGDDDWGVGSNNVEGGKWRAYDAFDESDEEEATAVRFSEPAPDSEPNLPMAMEDFKSISKEAAQGEDITVRVIKTKSESSPAELPDNVANRSSARTSPELPANSDLPAIVGPGRGASVKPRSPLAGEGDATKRPSKTPSADELRQRYGDLPLIIGGKRLGTRPSESPDQTAELPLVRPQLDTMVDGATSPDFDEDSLPAIRTPNAPQKTIPDSHIHAELPLVGVGTQERREPNYQAPLPQKARIPPPARPPARPGVATTSTTQTTGDVPYPLSDNDLVEEPRSQPPSTARISVRPAMRSEPSAEATLPVPNLPPRSSSPSVRRPINESLESARAPATGARPLPVQVEARRSAVPAQTQKLGEVSAPVSVEYPRPHLEPPRIAPIIATAPLSNLSGRDLGYGHSPTPLQQPHYGVGVPLLIDVTPLSLCVETVGSYSDVLIERNTPVPCERTREFVTVQDGQQVVRVRVAQGESKIFSENLLLGELELTGLRAAPRGQLQISVTFGLDSDGILHVRAIDLDTGRAATSELRLAGIPSPAEVAHMASRHLATS